MSSLIVYSLKNTVRKKGVSLLAILGVAVGVALMVFILSSSAGVNKMFSESFTRAAGEIIVSSENAPMGLGIVSGSVSLLPKDYVQRIEKIEHIESVSPRVMTVISSESLKSAEPFFVLVGVDPQRDKKSKGPTTAIIEGRSFIKENEVIIGKTRVDSVEMAGKRKINIRDKIDVVIPPKRKGDLPKKIQLTIVGKFETGNFLEDYYIFASEDTVRKISGIESSKINNIVVKVDSIDNVEMVDKAIKKEFKDADPPVQTLLNKNIFSNLQGTLKTFTNFRIAISIVAGIAGGMCILIVMLISVIERKKEFGILKAVGWSNANITLSILIESLFLSLTGVTVGLVMGWLGIFLAGKYISVLKDFLFLNWQVISLILGFGILLGVIGGIYPAWKASKVVPMETLRGD
jgi:putative ABC transport system permease protein